VADPLPGTLPMMTDGWTDGSVGAVVVMGTGTTTPLGAVDNPGTGVPDVGTGPSLVVLSLKC
jgi:hypothetical protein